MQVLVTKYRELVEEYENSQVESDYVRIICKINGGLGTNPRIFFDQKGCLKRLSLLKEMAEKHMGYIVKSNTLCSSTSSFLMTNLDQYNKSISKWKSLDINSKKLNVMEIKSWVHKNLFPSSKVFPRTSCLLRLEIMKHDPDMSIRYLFDSRCKLRSYRDILSAAYVTRKKKIKNKF